MSLIAAALILQVAVATADCRGGLCDAHRLEPFLTKLAKARDTGSGGRRRPVRIIQIGDSHSAGDQVTGTWRTLLQNRYGSGGRGVLAPGRPYAGYLARGVTVRESPGWTHSGIFGSAWRGQAAGPVGLAAYSAAAAAAGATMSLRADPSQPFDRLTVCAMRGPDAGAISLTIGQASVTWSLADARVHPDCTTIDSAGVTADAGLAVVRGPVVLTSWATERRGAGGVVLSNLGTVGAQFVHADRIHDAVAARELREYDPDLIVIAFGTNEAFWPLFTAAGYNASLQAGIRRIKRLAPGVPILMLGAPDSATRLASLQSGSAGPSATCPASASASASAAASAAGAGAGAGAGLAIASPGGEASPPWRPPAALATVQAIQRRTAHDLGIAYWDWSTRMGGRCAADGWVRRTPPLMRGDHVHFTTPGAAIIAGRLQEDIDAALAVIGDDFR